MLSLVCQRQMSWVITLLLGKRNCHTYICILIPNFLVPARAFDWSFLVCLIQVCKYIRPQWSNETEDDSFPHCQRLWNSAQQLHYRINQSDYIRVLQIPNMDTWWAAALHFQNLAAFFNQFHCKLIGSVIKSLLRAVHSDSCAHVNM